MIPIRFRYHAPATVAEAIERLAGDPQETRLLGGGTWVVPDLNRGALRPRHVIDLRRAGLDQIRVTGEGIVVGAMCTYGQLAADAIVREHLPLLGVMADGITGGAQITRQATIGCSAVAARPQSDGPATLVALRAEAILRSATGERRVAATELFCGAMQTAVRRDEVLVDLVFASQRGGRFGYAKLKRGASSWPIATAAVTVGDDETGRCGAVALSLGGVAATPVDVDVFRIFDGQGPAAALIETAAGHAATQITHPWGDVLAQRIAPLSPSRSPDARSRWRSVSAVIAVSTVSAVSATTPRGAERCQTKTAR